MDTQSRASLDRGLLLVTLFLIGLGLVQVYSSSFMFAIENYNDGLYFFRRQFWFAVLAVVVLIGVAQAPGSWVRNVGPWLFLLCVGLVALTYIPGLGVKVGGAQRWLKLPFGQRLEPSEMLKVTFGFWLAYVLTRRWLGAGVWINGLILILTTAPFVLLLKQPDFGSFAILVTVALAVFFVRGLPWRWVFAGLATSAFGFYFLIVQVPYRMARLKAYLDPWSDPEAKGFQVIQSLLSFYSGGLTGAGLGQGQGKLFFLPEAHTDFTASVLAEEMGFIGVLVTLCLFGFVILRGFQIAARARDPFVQIIAIAVTVCFGLSALLNFSVAMGLLPTKGMALPFLSYGGSSLVASALAVGLLLNIDRSQRLNAAGGSFKGMKVK
jgi:cell division protein FtsW